MSADKITTIVGAIGAAATAAQPVLTAVQPGAALHSQDYFQLVTALVFAVMGFFTNRRPAQG